MTLIYLPIAAILSTDILAFSIVSLSIIISPVSFSKQSNIFGKVIYEGKNEIIVEAINLINGDIHNAYLDKYGNYSFYNLDVSKYQVWAYENINPINNTYFNGTIEPLKYAARFGYYKGIVETRAKWDIEEIRIRIN